MSAFQKTIRSHGLTPEQHRQMVLDQEGLCAVCGRYEHLVIDHDHRCCPGLTSCGGCVRGLLCNGCNTALGLVKDNPETVARMLDYLVRQPERKPQPTVSREPVPHRITVSEDVRTALLGAGGPLGISELARRTSRSKAAVHEAVHRMADQGEVRLTPKGYGLA